jgi:hypothetical protein
MYELKSIMDTGYFKVVNELYDYIKGYRTYIYKSVSNSMRSLK